MTLVGIVLERFLRMYGGVAVLSTVTVGPLGMSPDDPPPILPAADVCEKEGGQREEGRRGDE